MGVVIYAGGQFSVFYGVDSHTILMFMVASGRPTLGPQAPEREGYMPFIYLSIYLSIANGVDAWGGIEEKRDCIISNLFDRTIVIKVNDAS